MEEFCQVAHIKTKLEEWKFVFPDSYSLAHVPLYLPQLFAPFARLELLRWNPLEVRGNGGKLGDYFRQIRKIIMSKDMSTVYCRKFG